MNIGVLGSGFMGSTHARAFAKLPDVHVIAVSSRSIEKAAKLAAEVGAQPTADDMAIVRDPSIDAISNTLPTHLHRKYTVAALEAGKHVLVEKPFGLTVDDCDAMIAAHDRSDKVLMVAHVLRFWPEYVALANLVKSGKLGKPLAAVASRLQTTPGWATWLRDPQLSGGAVLDLMIHDIDALNWLLGTPKTIYARGRESRQGSWDHMHVVLDYGDSHAFIEASEFMPAAYPFTMTLKVLCEGGSVEFAFRAGGASVEMGVGGTSLVVYEPGKVYPLEVKAGDAYQVQVAYFVDCIKSNTAPMLGTAEQARLAVVLSQAARVSLESGRVVAFKRKPAKRASRTNSTQARKRKK
jgi:UDP-N-acetylglucosamine 3-dehydrogenase